MRALNESEIDDVSGGSGSGSGLRSAGYAILGISTYSPATIAFGYPIGLSLLYLAHRRDAGT